MVAKIANLFNDDEIKIGQNMSFFVKVYRNFTRVFFFVLMADLWFQNLTLNSLVVDPTYCTLHLLQMIK